MKRKSADTSKKSKKGTQGAQKDKGKKSKPRQFPLAAISPLQGDTHAFSLVEGEMPKEARLYLAEHGYVVIKDAISAKGQEALLKNLGEDFAAIGTGITPDLMESPSNMMFPSLFSKGIIKDPTAGLHAGRAAWEARRMTQHVFAALYNVTKKSGLVSSVDSIASFRGPDKQYLTDNPWWHVDSNGPSCVQGLLLLTDAVRTTGGLVVVPGSHRPDHFKKTLADLPSTKSNFLPIS